MASQGESNTSFSKWKYAHYFTLVEHKDKNLLVKCETLLKTCTCLYCGVAGFQSAP